MLIITFSFLSAIACYFFPPPLVDRSRKGIENYINDAMAAFVLWSDTYPVKPNLQLVELEGILSLSDAKIRKLDEAALKWLLLFTYQMQSSEDQGGNFAKVENELRSEWDRSKPDTVWSRAASWLQRSLSKPEESVSVQGGNRYTKLKFIITRIVDLYDEDWYEGTLEGAYRTLNMQKHRVDPDYGKVHRIFKHLTPLNKIMPRLVKNLTQIKQVLNSSNDQEQALFTIRLLTDINEADRLSASLATDKTIEPFDRKAMEMQLNDFEPAATWNFTQNLLVTDNFVKDLKDTAAMVPGHVEGVLLRYLAAFVESHPLTDEERNALKRLETDLTQFLETLKLPVWEKLKWTGALKVGEGRMFVANSDHHAMLAYISRTPSFHYKVELLNSGRGGLSMHTKLPGEDEKAKVSYKMTFDGLTQTDLIALNMLARPKVPSKTFYHDLQKFRMEKEPLSGSTKGQKGGSCVLYRWFLRANQVLPTYLAKQLRFDMEIRVIDEYLRYAMANQHPKKWAMQVSLVHWADSKVKKIQACPSPEYAFYMLTHLKRVYYQVPIAVEWIPDSRHLEFCSKPNGYQRIRTRVKGH